MSDMSEKLPPYEELKALLAVMDDEPEELDRILDEMLPNELHTFHEQVYRLSGELYGRLRRINEDEYRARHRREGG
jgi:hypothetical protein